MSLRWKIALALALTRRPRVIEVAGYRLTSDRLNDEVDRSLLDRPAAGRTASGRSDDLPERGPFNGFEAQLAGPGGQVGQHFDDGRARRGGADVGANGPTDVRHDDRGRRLPGANGRPPRGALQVARSLDETAPRATQSAVRMLILRWRRRRVRRSDCGSPTV